MVVSRSIAGVFLVLLRMACIRPYTVIFREHQAMSGRLCTFLGKSKTKLSSSSVKSF